MTTEDSIRANRQQFRNALEDAYNSFRTTRHPDYPLLHPENDGKTLLGKPLPSPEQLAERMMDSFLKKQANKDGEGVRLACKACGIKQTYKEIYAFLGV